MKWIALTESKLICGIGLSKDEALHDAVEHIGRDGAPIHFKTMPCTNTLYRYIHDHGVNPARLPWVTVHGIAYLPHEA